MSVDLRPGESFEGLLKRFRKEVSKARILSTYRRKRWFTPPSEERRLAKKKAERRARRRKLRSIKPTKRRSPMGGAAGGPSRGRGRDSDSDDD
jgi:small subunit ribosomal protein S21